MGQGAMDRYAARQLAATELAPARVAMLAGCASVFIPAPQALWNAPPLTPMRWAPTLYRFFPPARACGAPKRPTSSKLRFLAAQRAKHDLTPLVIHANYLINLAAPPSSVRESSIHSFRGELERGIIIGAEYLVVHPGNYKGLTLEQGMLNVAEGYCSRLARCRRKSQNTSPPHAAA